MRISQWKKTKKTTKKRKENTKIYLQDIHNKNIFSRKLLTTNFHPPPNGFCSNFKWCYVENENVMEILTSYKHPLQAQESLSFENQIKNISCFCTPTIFKSNEWVIYHWQVNSSLGWYLPGDIYSPKNLDVRSAKQFNCLGKPMIPC